MNAVAQFFALIEALIYIAVFRWRASSSGALRCNGS
jgi:hypothetical protein